MSKRYYELFIFDILIAILKIKNTIKDYTCSSELYKNYMAWDSVIREFEIIGESVNNLIKLDVLPKELREIVDFRNVLIHSYFELTQKLSGM